MSRAQDVAELKRLAADLRSKVEQARQAGSADLIAVARQALLPVKLQLIKFQLVPPFDSDGLTDQQREEVLSCARSTWESGVLFSIATRDIDGFMRYVVQARAYYFELRWVGRACCRSQRRTSRHHVVVAAAARGLCRLTCSLCRFPFMLDSARPTASSSPTATTAGSSWDST